MSAALEVAGAVDSDALVELVRAAVRIPSVTPNEEAFANWVFGRLNESEAFGESELVECAPNRPNVHGTAGGGSGRSLLLAGHLDTVATDDWTEHWQGTGGRHSLIMEEHTMRPRSRDRAKTDADDSGAHAEHAATSPEQGLRVPVQRSRAPRLGHPKNQQEPFSSVVSSRMRPAHRSRILDPVGPPELEKLEVTDARM
ncbi:MAG: hypothetical protein OXB92_07835 [Acidimicrobiaceae bacterium]|nr:hypothetical protein [Acidimicrobiia bacterium]MCY4493748.1 hypothetical protein [Acidimicrobiaceae bacterium]